MRECICWNSWSCNSPFRNLTESIRASLAINRFTNCTDDISKEKIATPILWSIAVFLAIESIKAVFPIPGLAASTIISERCHPAVILSKS